MAVCGNLMVERIATNCHSMVVIEGTGVVYGYCMLVVVGTGG